MEILRNITKDNLQRYSEDFFKDNILIIIPIQYGNNADRIDISKISLKSNSMTIDYDIYESTENISLNEFFFVFIALAKNQNMKWDYESINNYSIDMEQNTIEPNSAQ